MYNRKVIIKNLYRKITVIFGLVLLTFTAYAWIVPSAIATCRCYCTCGEIPGNPPNPPTCDSCGKTCRDDFGNYGCEVVNTRTCFAAGTKVRMGDETNKKIEDVKVGDKVVSQNEQGEKSMSNVVELDQPIREHMCKLSFKNGSSLKMTEEHPLMTQDGWKALDPNKTKDENPDLIVKKLLPGDVVVREDGVRAELDTVSCWSERTPAYNLILDQGAHTYFADGFLAHNKYQYPKCPNPAQEVACSTSVNKSFCVNYIQGCGNEFPSDVYSSMSCPVDNPDPGPPDSLPGLLCQVNCGCCNTGQVWDCNSTTTYVLHAIGAGGTCTGKQDTPIGGWTLDPTFRDPQDCNWGFNNNGVLQWQCKKYMLTCQRYSCACKNPCTKPPAVSLVSPATNTEISAPSGSANVTFDWNAPANWGTGEVSGLRKYDLCVGTNATNPCAGGTKYTISSTATTSPASTRTVSLGGGKKYWGVDAVNRCGEVSALSAVRNVCVERFSATNTNFVSAWTPASTCGTRTYTRTCTQDCSATNNCAGIATTKTECTECGPVVTRSACSDITHKRTITTTYNCQATVTTTEDCQGVVSGTLFDASDMSVCPSFNPVTGYSNLPAGTGIASRDFALNDVNNTAPHPFVNPLTSARTDANGNYSITVYPKATYQLSFDLLADKYLTTPKLTCNINGTGTQAALVDNPVTCATQPCSTVKGVSFGFVRVFGGWWQVVGGNVYADKGLGSAIPSTVPVAEQYLILPDSTAGNRLGLLSYGLPKPLQMLGPNPNAQVSSRLWEKESKYAGQYYNWDFYNVRFNIFTKTPWGDGQAINYTDDDSGTAVKGYQIFKSDQSITSFAFSPTASPVPQKAIFHVSGDVLVTDNIIVPPGAFLAVIAKGSITFAPNVTRADGWYVADNIQVPCKDLDGLGGCDKTDVPFAGNGSFIGWGSIDLSRDLGGGAAGNNTQPAEKFTYRVDLFNNAPDPMKFYKKWYKPFIP